MSETLSGGSEEAEKRHLEEVAEQAVVLYEEWLANPDDVKTLEEVEAELFPNFFHKKSLEFRLFLEKIFGKD